MAAIEEASGKKSSPSLADPLHAMTRSIGHVTVVHQPVLAKPSLTAYGNRWPLARDLRAGVSVKRRSARSGV